MFDPKQTIQPNSPLEPKKDEQTTPDLTNFNSDKKFPFKKVDNIDSQDSVPQPKKDLSGSKGPVEDMLAGTDKPKPTSQDLPQSNLPKTPIGPVLKSTPQVPSMQNRPEIKTPPSPIISERKNMPPAHPPQVDKSQQIKPKKNNLFTILIAIIIVIVLGLAGVYAYQYFTQPEENQAPDESLQNLLDMLDQEESQAEQETDNMEDEAQDITEQDKILDEDLEAENIEEDFVEQLIDTDEDGLLDEIEIGIGTNPNKFDTDDDGLSDFEEVEIYYSNPIQQDTDGDGYNDGDEVQNGFDPLKGEGAKL